MPNPLVATATDTGTGPWAGIWIAEDIEMIVQGVQSGSWIDGTLGAVGAGLDALAFVPDPVGALLQYGIAYRAYADRRAQELGALARAADGMALMTEGAGQLIGTVRLMVRDAVATVVSRLRHHMVPDVDEATLEKATDEAAHLMS